MSAGGADDMLAPPKWKIIKKISGLVCASLVHVSALFFIVSAQLGQQIFQYSFGGGQGHDSPPHLRTKM